MTTSRPPINLRNRFRLRHSPLANLVISAFDAPGTSTGRCAGRPKNIWPAKKSKSRSRLERSTPSLVRRLPGHGHRLRPEVAMNWMAQVSKCLIFSSLGVALCQSTPPATQRAPLRQSFDLQVRWNPTPVRVLGTSYLVYELHVINFAAHDLSLSRIAVIDSESGGVLGDFRGANLQEVIGRTDPTGRKDKLLIPPAVHVTAYLSVPLISNGSAPR